MTSTQDGQKKGLLDRLTHFKETFEAGGIDFPGAGSALFLWQRFGAKGLLLIILLVGFPLGEYSLLRWAVYSGIPRTVGDLGLEFEAEEWSLAPLRLKATARDVTLRGPDSETPVFTAASVEFDGSFWTFVSSLPDMLTFHLFGGQQPFNDVTISNGELHLERSLTGRLNWWDFAAAIPRERIDEALAGVYQVQRLRLEDFRVSYVEHTPAGSGDGVIRTAQSQIKVDEITATIVDLVQPEEAGEQPTRFTVAGRSADGTFEIAGTAALLPPRPETPSSVPGTPGLQRVSSSDAAVMDTATTRPFEVTIFLDNIAAAAYGRMVPVTTIVPVNGSIEGTMKIVRVGATPVCEGAFTMRDVRFAPNPMVLPDSEDVELVRTAVTRLSYSGPFTLCDVQPASGAPSPNRNVPGEPPASAMLVRLNEQATSQASPGVKALVQRDRQQLRGEIVNGTVDDLTSALAEELGLRVARSVGGRVGDASGNALTSGLRSVGGGIRRLFGGGR
jgi:hypothetical protein